MKVLLEQLWGVLFSLGVVFFGVHYLRKWRKAINPNASEWDRTLTERNYLILGMNATIGGPILGIIVIPQICANWLNPALWFSVSAVLIFIGIVLIRMWKKQINPQDIFWDKMLANKTYPVQGITSIIWGSAFLILALSQALK